MKNRLKPILMMLIMVVLVATMNIGSVVFAVCSVNGCTATVTTQYTWKSTTKHLAQPMCSVHGTAGMTGNLENHSGGSWIKGSDSHYKQCSKCSGYYGSASHTYSNNTCTVCGYTTGGGSTTPTGNYINVTKNTGHSTLADAINNAASGNTIRMTANVTDTTAVTVNKNIILDTNGKTLTKNTSTITVNSGCTFELKDSATTKGGIAGDALIITNNGTVKVTSGSIQNTSQTSTSNRYTIQNNSSGTLTVQGGTVSSRYRTVNNSGGTINLTSGALHVWTNNASAVVNAMAINSIGGTLNVSGGQLSCQNSCTANNTAAYTVMGSLKTTNITGGWIYAKATGGSAHTFYLSTALTGSTFNVSGGEITSESAGAKTDSQNVYVRVLRFLGSSSAHLDIAVTISGNAKLTAKVNSAITNSNAIVIGYNNSPTTINGGTITGDIIGIYIRNSGTLTIGDGNAEINTTTPLVQGGVYGIDGPFTFNNGLIKGVTPYSTTPTVRAGATIANGSDPAYGNTRYLEPGNYLNTRTGAFYGALQTAINGATSGDTIKLMKGITEEGAITVNKNIVFDLNGLILAKITESITVNAGCTFEVTDSSGSSGSIYGNYTNNPIIYNRGTLKVTKGTIINVAGTFDTTPYSVVNLSTGTIIVQGGAIGSCYRTIYNDGGTINLTSGTIYANFANGQAVNLTMSVIGSVGGNINISGGNLYCNNTSSSVDLAVSANAIGIGNSVQNLTITGGNIWTKAKGSAYTIMLDSPLAGSKINISGSPTITAESVGVNSSSIWVRAVRVCGSESAPVSSEITITGTPTITGIGAVGNVVNSIGFQSNSNTSAINIKGGTITGGSYGIYYSGASTGTLTIGDGSANINRTNPTIQGMVYGVIGAFTFNNGIIKGGTPYNIAPTVRSGANIASGTDATYTNTRYLEIRNYQNVQKSTYYETLQAAVEDATAGNTIKLLTSNLFDNVAATIDKNIIFDTNGKVVFRNGGQITINQNCTFEVTDSAESVGNLLITSVQSGIINNGTLMATRGWLQYTVPTSDIYGYTVVNNSTGTIIVNGGNITSQYKTIKNNGGTINLISGSIYSKYYNTTPTSTPISTIDSVEVQ